MVHDAKRTTLQRAVQHARFQLEHCRCSVEFTDCSGKDGKDGKDGTAGRPGRPGEYYLWTTLALVYWLLPPPPPPEPVFART